MSDTPDAPDWWQATDGRWYPPEQFTGPPEMLPSLQADPEAVRRAAQPFQPAQPVQPAQPFQPDPAAQPDHSDRSDRSDPAASRSRRPLIVAVAAVVVVALLAVGAFVLLGGDDDTQSNDADVSFDSTSTGPVRVSGTIAISASVPTTTLMPDSCDNWVRLLRVDIADESGASLTNFMPEIDQEGDLERGQDVQTLSCTFTYAAKVPAASSYSVGVINLGGPATPAQVQTLDGAKKGDVTVPEFALDYVCDTGSRIGGCLLRPRG